MLILTPVVDFVALFRNSADQNGVGSGGLPLGRLLAVQPVDAREFVDWESLRSYLRSYAQRTSQLYVEHSVVDVATHNASMAQSDPEEPPVPEHLAVFSQVFGCVHGSERPISNMQQSSQYWTNTQCAALIQTHVTRDWQGRWRVVIADQFAYHNHGIPASLIQQYAACAAERPQVQSERPKKQRRRRQSQRPEAEAVRVAVEIIDLTQDQDTSDDADSVTSVQPQSDATSEPPAQALNPEDDADSATNMQPQSEATSEPPAEDLSSEDDVVAPYCGNNIPDAGDLDRCASNDEATEAEKLDHFVGVHPMPQRVFEDWAELAAYIKEYNRSTLQLYVVSYSRKVNREMAKPREKAIPERFRIYRKVWICVHSLPRDARYVVDCPAKIVTHVKRKGPGGWKIVILQQIAIHNHHVNETLFKRLCAPRPRLKYPSTLHACIMKLYFDGVRMKDIMEDIRQRSDIEPEYRSVYDLIGRLKREGWTADGAKMSTTDVDREAAQTEPS